MRKFSFVLIWVLSACVSISPTNSLSSPTPILAGPSPSSPITPLAAATSFPTLPLTPGQIQYQTLQLTDGTVLEYGLVLPANFDTSKEYPILLALPPGDQTHAMVQAGLNSYWATEAIAREWIVLSPVAPGALFVDGSEKYIPEFLQTTAQTLKPEGGRYHLAGISNGGISAFRIAGEHPELFRSLTVLPGYALSDADREHLALLTDIPVRMYVGERDATWVRVMRETETELLRHSADVTLKVMSGQEHMIRTVSGADLFDELESFRP